MAVFCNYTLTAVMVQDFEFDDEHLIKLKVHRLVLCLHELF